MNFSWTKGASIGWHSDDNRPYLKQRDYAVCVYSKCLLSSFVVTIKINTLIVKLCDCYSLNIFIFSMFKAVCYLNSYGVDFGGGLFHFQDGEPTTFVPMAGVSCSCSRHTLSVVKRFILFNISVYFIRMF